MVEISCNKVAIQRRRATRSRVARYAVILVALLVVGGLWTFRGLLFDENFHTVIPNEVYRSSQPSSVALERRIRELGIRSVINLRTSEREAPWFKVEHAVTKAHGVDLHLIRFTGDFMPPRATLRQLVHLLDTARRPLLLHCESGIERSGIASAVAVLLAGGNVAEAQGQFGLIYGFVPLISSPELPKVLDNYKHWLAAQGWSHTPERFRRWVENDYIPYFYRARLEPLDVPTSIAKGNKAILHFRATNTSPQPWIFKSERDRGVRLAAKIELIDPSVKQEIELRGGFHDLTVEPGEAAVLELEIPPLLESGRYQFLVDLVDEQVKWFSDMGSEPISFELRVEE